MSDIDKKFEEGLLFYLSGNNGGTADYAFGDPEPVFFEKIETVDSGVNGKALRVGVENSRFSHYAPGNIYAQRGTLSFFWRSIYPLGPTEFPIFRVAYADHTSWDTVWMRIDYNGWGFDAFVTDINLSRTRVSYSLQPMPKPDQWTHIALSWDENTGMKFYINGVLVRERSFKGIYDAGLDSFGPGGRLIGFWGSQNRYNFIRPGDMCEFKIHDRMLSDENVRSLSLCKTPVSLPSTSRNFEDEAVKYEWRHRFGFDRDDLPAVTDGNFMSVKKLQIQDPYDLKRWCWKITDGIRETTWPGVYNRSQLDGRTDYFVLPDWDCYSLSGKEISMTIPGRNCNYLEISGGAWGEILLENGEETSLLFKREKGLERSYHKLDNIAGKKIRFVNEMKEQPLGDISAFEIGFCKEPEDAYKLNYKLSCYEASELTIPVEEFIRKRYMPDERMMVSAVPSGTKSTEIDGRENNLPFVHVLLPFENLEESGLDGIAIDIPALNVKASHEEYHLLNIQVKDPVWQYRNMINITVAVKPHEPKTLWLDLRDRILPDKGCLYITFAGASGDFNASSLSDAAIRLVFKPCELAKEEHVSDRFTQVRDHFSNMVEERPTSTKFNAFNRFYADLTDLLRVDPQHQRAKEYYYLHLGGQKPACELPECPTDVPLWAFAQTQFMKHVRHVLKWWIDDRQIENGEFGGGLSDDGDLTAIWPGPYLVGSMPEKIKESLERQMDAFYDQDMFSSGLCKIQTDQLHTLEDGIQVIGQCLVVNPSSPRHLERAMETARAMWTLTGINPAGHLHFKTAYYSGHKFAWEKPWNFSNSDTYNVLHPVYMLARYNGNKMLIEFLTRLADSMLEHYRDGKVYSSIVFDTDEDKYIDQTSTGHSFQEDFLFKAVYEFTGDEKYIKPVHDRIIWAARNNGGIDKSAYEKYYLEKLEAALLLDYINTEGHVWSDRVIVEYDRIQQDRLGGIGHVRFDFYPRNHISWKFDEPATDESVGIIVPFADKSLIKIVVFNLESFEVDATVIGSEVLPGIWSIKQGQDTNLADEADCNVIYSKAEFGREEGIRLVFPPKQQTVIELKLLEEGIPYWERPDLGICREDINIAGSELIVTVHNLGSIDTPEQELVLRNADGEIVSRAVIPPLKAPVFLYPCTCDVALDHTGITLTGCSVEIDPDSRLVEISKQNNIVHLL